MAKDRHVRLGLYRHSKTGDIYEVVAIGTHSETLEPLVVYVGMYWSENFGNNPVWVRPLKMFTEMVEINGRKVPRYEFIEELI